MNEISIITDSADDTHRLAALVARHCDIGDCILLHGDLGAGKTAFSRGFIKSLQPDAGEIVSPTFTIVQQYAGSPTIWHFDLYRLKDKEELREVGLEEALESGITLIEWPDIAQALLPKAVLTIAITFGDAPDRRIFTLSGADSWQPLLAAAQKAFYK